MSRYLVVHEIKGSEVTIEAETDSIDQARKEVAESKDGSYQILKIMTEPITVKRITQVRVSGGGSTSPRKKKGGGA